MIKSNERSRFDMVEFGEQLRRAREGKGMTQQSLAAVSYTHLDVYKRQYVYSSKVILAAFAY